MDKKKIYVIEKTTSNSMFLSNKQAIGFCINKIDAEYEVWKLKNLSKSSPFNYTYTGFSFCEVNLYPTEKDKNYTKFIKEKIDEVNSNIKSSKECIGTDHNKITELNKELDFYNFELGNPVFVK